ncbi:MAG TPA: DUF58 domain-containing protein [Sandaracinaceae bacterium LLY-WYZ-13_1]|nr:DUF58 domain-containing protein [Sandaracinaceae bacterium LLY-WYZ-13_1]
MAFLDRVARRVLDRMRLTVRPTATAMRQGGHRSPFKASGVEFADHRPYVTGDDVRHIDWKAFARHGQLVMRQFEEEKDAFIHLLLDVTGSMSRGEPPKIDVARRLAASFTYVGVRQFDRVRVVPFADVVEEVPLALHGPQDLPHLERYLSEEDAAGPTFFDEAVKQLASRGAPRGLVVVISDLMAPEGWEDGFRRLGAMGHDIRVVRVGCAEDLDPAFEGELELRDAETDERVRLRVGKGLLERYRVEVKKHLEACRDACRRAGGRWIEVDVAMPTDAMLKRVFAAPEGRSAAS